MEIVKGLVTTIIPVYNRPTLLIEAVRSVLSQTYRPIEIIIVDDGSTDETIANAKALEAEHPDVIRLLQKENAGPGLAREAGRVAAKGEFIQYLDSDDLLLPQKFEMQVTGLTKRADCGISYGKTHYCLRGNEAERISWKQTGQEISHVFPEMLKSRWWGTSTPLYRRALVDQVGSWSKLSSEEDWEYDCRFGALGVALQYVPEFVSIEREHTGARLSRAGTSDPKKMRDATCARRHIFQHALAAGIKPEHPEMQIFARSLFLLSRQCGAIGLGKESFELFNLAKQASGRHRAKGLDFFFYRVATLVFGWVIVGRLACLADKMRP